jgi:hypothetical protein
MLIGCSPNGKLSDLSKCSVFAGSVQSEESIKRPCAIIQQKGLSSFHMVELDDDFLGRAIEKNTRRSGSFKIVYLNRDDSVFVEEVNVESIHAGPTYIVAHGKVKKSGADKWLDFEYFWSDLHLIPRAPWDGIEAEELRLLELNEDYTCVN